MSADDCFGLKLDRTSEFPLNDSILDVTVFVEKCSFLLVEIAIVVC